MLPQIERLRTVFKYDENTGTLHWRSSGQLAGHMHSTGHLRVGIDGSRCYVHRVIWAMQTGSWPEGQIDHINGNRADNHWYNLRECSNAENNLNKGPHKDSTSGRKGVCWHKTAQKWSAQIAINGVREYLGLFDSVEEAAMAYDKRAKELEGEFYSDRRTAINMRYAAND